MSRDGWSRPWYDATAEGASTAWTQKLSPDPLKDLMSRDGWLPRPGYDATAEGASTAWTQKFGAPHVKLKRGSPDPLDVGKRLGSGGVGEVWATKIGGVPVALKRIYATHLTEAIFAELNIMRQIAKKRHHHIVQLIGSYQKRHTNISELGLLIWPVATCDLAALLHDFNIAHSWWVHGQALEEKTDYDEEDVIYAIESLARLESTTSSPDIIKKTDPEFLELYNKTRSRLKSSIGCIANAVKWLHDCHIRHKDLKPSQILISASGLWLSDFGWSRDVSEMTCSTTVGGKTTTPKYLAPERALKQPCGRPEDIFSLGCIFLEIGHEVFRLGKTDVPWFQPGWLYSKNVEQVRELASTLVALSPKLPLPHEVLMALVVRMLNEDPALRPSITKVVDTLAAMSAFSDCCCSPTPSANQNIPQFSFSSATTSPYGLSLPKLLADITNAAKTDCIPPLYPPLFASAPASAPASTPAPDAPERSSNINNAISRISQSVNHRTTPLSSEGNYIPVPHSQPTSNGHHLSYQDSNSMFARGHKRSLAEASSGHQIDKAPTKQIRPDYYVTDPRRLSTSGTTDGSNRRLLSITNRTLLLEAPLTADQESLPVRPETPKGRFFRDRN